MIFYSKAKIKNLLNDATEAGDFKLGEARNRIPFENQCSSLNLSSPAAFLDLHLPTLNSGRL